MADRINLTNPAALAALARGDIENAIAASTPGGILAQEAAGQALLVASQAILPKRINGYQPPTREQVTDETGIVFGEEHDDIFVKVTLPPGWKLQPTAHSMNNELLDENGVVRASVFYKAAFYDRNADISFMPRYTIHKTYDDSPVTVSVRDRKTSADIHVVGTYQPAPDNASRQQYMEDYEARNRLENQAVAWLDENKPDWREPFAYWKD